MSSFETAATSEFQAAQVELLSDIDTILASQEKSNAETKILLKKFILDQKYMPSILLPVFLTYKKTNNVNEFYESIFAALDLYKMKLGETDSEGEEEEEGFKIKRPLTFSLRSLIDILKWIYYTFKDMFVDVLLFRAFDAIIVIGLSALAKRSKIADKLFSWMIE